MISNRQLETLTFALLTCAVAVAHAGRPLATDDASTAKNGSCQVEAWDDSAGNQHAYVIAPACGVSDELELGADVTYTKPSHDAVAQVGLALKWVRSGWEFDTALGKLKLGAKLAFATTRTVDVGWELHSARALGLATLTFAPSVTAHFSVGPQRDRQAARTSTFMNTAVVWAPAPAGLLFAEAQASDQGARDGGTIRTLGARWWLLADVIGLDLTASRIAGTQGPTLWSIGFGWYGLGQ